MEFGGATVLYKDPAQFQFDRAVTHAIINPPEAKCNPEVGYWFLRIQIFLQYTKRGVPFLLPRYLNAFLTVGEHDQTEWQCRVLGGKIVPLRASKVHREGINIEST